MSLPVTATSTFSTVKEWHFYDGASYRFHNARRETTRYFRESAPCDLQYIWNTVSMRPSTLSCLRRLALADQSLIDRLKVQEPEMYYNMRAWHMLIVSEGNTTYFLRTDFVPGTYLTEDGANAKRLSLAEFERQRANQTMIAHMPDRLFFATPTFDMGLAMSATYEKIAAGKVFI